MHFEAVAERRFLTPLLALRGIQAEFERMLTDAGPEPSNAMGFALYTREDGLLLRTPLPGVDPKKIVLEVDGNALTLSGQFEDEPAAASAVAKHIERARGSFTRSLRLPFEVDAARVQAKFEHGVLEVEIPRIQKNPPVKINVVSGQEELAPRN